MCQYVSFILVFPITTSNKSYDWSATKDNIFPYA